jgi:hypothetical protein
MPNPSFRESGLGFVTVLIRQRLLGDVFRRQMLQKIEPEFHRT